MTVRLDDETDRMLRDLAKLAPSASAAVHQAIRRAWVDSQYDRLEQGYAEIVAENPHYPRESAEEARAVREHRAHRRERDYD